jgi:hypothetical protein
MIEPDMRVHEIVGNLHIHTVYSDGTGLHRDVAQAAARAGLDFVAVTDHNVWVDGVEGYYDDLLLLVGEEIHDVRRLPQANHLLVYGADRELATEAGDPQGLIDAVRAAGGVCFLAHPFERRGRAGPDLAPIPWEDWDVEGFTGIELWNAMSEFKGLLWSRLAAVIYAYLPLLGLRGPFRRTVRTWDELLVGGRRVAAIGGADAHAKTYSLGPLRRILFPYETLFGWVNTHLLIERPLSGDVAEDKALVYDALRRGKTWVGYDRIASTRGFRFQARSGPKVATIGDELVRAAAVTFEVETPEPGRVRLIRNGRTIVRGRGAKLSFTTGEAGVYRVEVQRRFRGQQRGWIFSSPIYVR